MRMTIRWKPADVSGKADRTSTPERRNTAEMKSDFERLNKQNLRMSRMKKSVWERRGSKPQQGHVLRILVLVREDKIMRKVRNDDVSDSDINLINQEPHRDSDHHTE